MGIKTPKWLLSGKPKGHVAKPEELQDPAGAAASPAACQGGDAANETCVYLLLQELRSREEELTRAALQQKSQEELLKRREQQLAEREIDVLERELNILIFQLNKDKPNVKKRKGKFKRSRLKLKDGNRISLPSGERKRTRTPRGELSSLL